MANMVLSQLSKMAALAAFLSTQGVLGKPTLRPYADAACETKMDATNKDDPDWFTRDNYFDVGPGVSNIDWIYNWWYDANFPDATGKNVAGASGASVWWKVENLDPGCRVVVGIPYTGVQRYGELPASHGIQMPGEQIVTLSTSQCTFSKIPVSVQWNWMSMA
jgi:hypothetical protein